MRSSANGSFDQNYAFIELIRLGHARATSTFYCNVQYGVLSISTSRSKSPAALMTLEQVVSVGGSLVCCTGIKDEVSGDGVSVQRPLIHHHDSTIKKASAFPHVVLSARCLGRILTALRWPYQWCTTWRGFWQQRGYASARIISGSETILPT